MSWSAGLLTLANLAQVVTGLVAATTGAVYVCKRSSRRRRLEQYLKAERDRDARGVTTFQVGRRTVAHLMAYVAMTESQVLEAGFGNTNLKSFPATDDKNGRAETLYFQYVGDEGSN